MKNPMFYQLDGFEFDHLRILKEFQEIINPQNDYDSQQWSIVGKSTLKDGTGSLASIVGEESDYNVLLPAFENTYISEVLDELSQKTKLFRIRFMLLGPKMTYSYHVDPSVRFHIPITANKHSWMIVEKEIFEFENGKVHVVDTTLPHTAINLDINRSRLHIVGAWEEV